MTSVVLESNRMKAAAEKLPFAGARQNPIKHVIYIIKENRTYDQIFGDLQKDGKPVANGDPSLTCTAKPSRPTCTNSFSSSVCSITSLTPAKCPAMAMSGPTPPLAPTMWKKTWQQAYRGGGKVLRL